ncbi:hypothetical protein [Azospirillum doebereinerae]
MYRVGAAPPDSGDLFTPSIFLTKYAGLRQTGIVDILFRA